MTGNKRNQTSPIGSPSSGNMSDGSSKEQDRFLPIANVSRIMKKSLPANAKISKEAKETVQECVSEFISFITGEASDKCQREKRKTINGDDLLWAMTTLGFENYVGPLKVYLNKYRETEGDKNLASSTNIHNARPQDDQGQLSPGNKYNNNTSSYGVLNSDLIKKVNDNSPPPLPTDLLLLRGHQEVDLRVFNGGFYSLGTQGIGGKSYGSSETSTNFGSIGYGENLMSGGFNLNRRIGGNVDGNGSNRAMAAQVNQGVGW